MGVSELKWLSEELWVEPIEGFDSFSRITLMINRYERTDQQFLFECPRIKNSGLIRNLWDRYLRLDDPLEVYIDFFMWNEMLRSYQEYQTEPSALWTMWFDKSYHLYDTDLECKGICLMTGTRRLR